MSLRHPSNRLTDASTGEQVTWADLEPLDFPAPAAVVVDSSYAALRAVKQHAETGAEFLVVAAGRMEANLRAELRAAGFNIVDPDGSVELRRGVPRAGARPPVAADLGVDRPPQADRAHPRVVDDRVGRHGTADLAAPVLARHLRLVAGGHPRPRLAPDRTWSLVDPARLDDWVAAGIEHGVSAASGTPTFWRQTTMAQRDDLAKVPLQQISLGASPSTRRSSTSSAPSSRRPGSRGSTHPPRSAPRSSSTTAGRGSLSSGWAGSPRGVPGSTWRTASS